MNQAPHGPEANYYPAPRHPIERLNKVDMAGTVELGRTRMTWVIGESKCGKHNQSSDPVDPIRAAVRISPMAP